MFIYHLEKAMTIVLLILVGTIICVVGIKNSFILNNEGWCVKQKIEGECKSVEHYRYNTGVLNRYIGGKDTLINVDWKNKDDRDLWYFVSPYLKWNADREPYAITFSITSFMGNFRELNEDVSNRAIIIKTDTSEFWLSLYENYCGNAKLYWIPFHTVTILKNNFENGFSKSSDRELIKMMKNKYQIAILGDWTRGVEMIGIDNVGIETM